MLNHFSENLKHYRKLRYMTQQELAKKLFITRQAVSTYENGIRHCDLDTLIRITQILGISLDDLIL
ncbi:MAG: helix-turn-helix transcriptional regulator [Ruminococcus sp.]|nr:helix-turn-helix transcriptional regulator [Ruminococcus sp.]